MDSVDLEKVNETIQKNNEKIKANEMAVNAVDDAIDNYTNHRLTKNGRLEFEKHIANYSLEEVLEAVKISARTYLKYDDNGRIILSPLMREMGEIGSHVLFMGLGHHFEIWAPEIFLAQEGQDPRVVKLVKALLAGRAQ